MSDQEDWDDGPSAPDGSSWGFFVAVAAQAALTGAYFLVLSPLWIPVAAYQRVKKAFEPKPVYRGTVRPLVPLAPRKAHSR